MLARPGAGGLPPPRSERVTQRTRAPGLDVMEGNPVLIPITRLTVVCDGCDTIAQDDQGTPCHFTTQAEAREWLALDPHAADDGDDLYNRWHFDTDGTHLCPDCQCAAHGHARYPHPDGPHAAERLGEFCIRCGRWLDPYTTATPDAVDGTGDGAATGRVA